MKRSIKLNFWKKANLLFLLAVLLLITPSLIAQDNYKAQKASVIISGTSTLHDWEMKATSFTCNAIFQIQNNKLLQVKGVTLSIPVQNLKSEKNAMDKNAYAALKAEKNKQINYTMTSAKIEGGVIYCTGNLAIAGVTKPKDIESTYIVNSDNTITCKSVTSFKMTEFNVEPPSFMFGSVNTGDEIKIAFELILKKTNP